MIGKWEIMTTSVCMGIYNGEKYIEQQLISIQKQSKTVDEVILCDDGSTDSTVDIVKKFIHDNKLEKSWKLFRNNENKGYPGNFYYAMSLCKGDVVFLADQDDIWSIDKVIKMCDVFTEHHEVNSLCCKFGLIDADEKKIYSIMQPVVSKETKEIKNITIENVFYKCEWPGMVMAYQRKWYAQRVEEWSSNFHDIFELKIPHDFLISAWAAEENGFFQLDEELAWHRRHDNNTGGEEYKIAKLIDKERKVEEIEKYLRILEWFKKAEVLKTIKGQDSLKRKHSVMNRRLEALLSGSVWNVVKSAWKNRDSIRFVTVICDIIIAAKC